MRPSNWTVRLAMLAGVALASCVIPNDTEAQQCDGVQIRDRGTDICVATEASLEALTARIDSLIAALEGMTPGDDPAVDSLRSELNAHLQAYAQHALEYGTLRDRVAAEAARTGALSVRLDSVIAALGDVTPPPADTTEQPPPIPAGDTALVVSVTSTTAVVEYRFDPAAWNAIQLRTADQGGGSHAAGPLTGVTASPQRLSVPLGSSPVTLYAGIVKWTAHPSTGTLVQNKWMPVVIPAANSDPDGDGIVATVIHPQSLVVEAATSTDEEPVVAVLTLAGSALPWVCLQNDGQLHEALVLAAGVELRSGGQTTPFPDGGPCWVEWTCDAAAGEAELGLSDATVIACGSGESARGDSFALFRGLELP